MVDFVKDAQVSTFNLEDELAENSNWMATLVLDYIQELDISPEATPSSNTTAEFPAGLLLEIAAIARLWNWEQVGIKEAIDPTLPHSEQALSDLNDRYKKQSFDAIELVSPLLEKVLWAWWNFCARGSRQALGIDVALQQPDQEELVEFVSQLLWRLRNVPEYERGSSSSECRI